MKVLVIVMTIVATIASTVAVTVVVISSGGTDADAATSPPITATVERAAADPLVTTSTAVSTTTAGPVVLDEVKTSIATKRWMETFASLCRPSPGQDPSVVFGHSMEKQHGDQVEFDEDSFWEAFDDRCAALSTTTTTTEWTPPEPQGIPVTELVAAAKSAMPYSGIADDPTFCNVTDDVLYAPEPVIVKCDFMASWGLDGSVTLTVVETPSGWEVLDASPYWVGD